MNVSLVYSLVLSQCMLISILVERFVAVVYIQDYESGYRLLGPALIATALLAAVLLIYFIFYGEHFDVPQLNGRSAPGTTYERSKVLFLSLLIANFVSVISSTVLYLASSRRQKMLTLSSRFQTNENTNTFGLLYWIFSIQFTALLFSQATSYYLVMYQHNNPLRFAYRENLDFFNYYSLILPLMSMLYLIRVKRRRIRDININIGIKATGAEGWTNYSTVIEKEWMQFPT
ncbi:hypothetical protein GCK32_006791 [Trichostrongylus colubriformis]|uniref:Uncharacterized protein n=1 Tax=Trichostrongylus colubriformis TaxID=6319 RepID=A0AAN8IL16_TRICO